MSIDISSMLQQREQRSVVNPISASSDVASKNNDVEAEIKEFSTPVDAVGEAKSNGDTEQQLKQGDVDKALSNLNDYAQNLQRDINFSVDETTNQTVIQVIDSMTEEVIRQIPSEDILALARTMELYADDNMGKIIYAQA